jgi:hypothetical protein
MWREIPEFFCPDSEVDVVLPSKSIIADETGDWLIIGWPGVDGIQFRMQNGSFDETVYAYYPYDDEHVKIAESAADLIQKWKSGDICF